MYLVHYVFYKVTYEDGIPAISNIELKIFGSPQSENTYVRDKRKNGYMCLRPTKTIYDLLEAALKEEVPVGVD